MKIESIIILSGLLMIISGLGMFYSIQNIPDVDKILIYSKHMGTFVGVMGIGVIMAGILLRLMEKEQPPIIEDFDN